MHYPVTYVIQLIYSITERYWMFQCHDNFPFVFYYCFRFFTEIASDVDIPDAGNHSLSFINDANVLALHRLLWNNQEKIGDYLSSSR